MLHCIQDEPFDMLDELRVPEQLPMEQIFRLFFHS